MGAEVEGVSRAARVAGSSSSSPESSGQGFGPWLRQQRELRGISIHFVAARTKLTPVRVREIERGSALRRDGHGRATARVLALAIGADPDEAVRQLTQASAAAPVPRRPRRLGPRARRASQLAVLVSCVLALWLLAQLLLRGDPYGERPAVVYRPDYVDRLLGDPP